MRPLQPEIRKSSRRRRGVVLNDAGLQRYHDAQRRLDNRLAPSARLSLERLSFEAGLSTKTIARVLDREMPVDLRTLELLFRGLGIALEPSDFVRAEDLTQTAGALPAPRTRFFGRRDQLGQLACLLRTSRCITLVGPGGIGKTRLAIEVAACESIHFDRVVYCDFSVVTDGSLVDRAIAMAFGGRPDIRSCRASVARAVERERVMLLFDNCEHVVARVASLAEDLVAGIPGLTLFATSREALGLHGEVVLRVTPLTVPTREPGLSIDAALAIPAVALFVDRARGADVDFRVDDAAIAAIAAIIARVEGVPLSIELAASRVASAALPELADSLRDHLRALVCENGRLGPRHRSATALIDWSFALLDDDERSVFRRIAAFMGGFDSAAAAAVCAYDGRVDHVCVLDRLAKKSLVVVDTLHAVTRYNMLETIRQFAALKLRESGEVVATRFRHAVYYDELLKRADRASSRTDQLEHFATIASERDNIREALEFCTNSENLHIAARMCCNLIGFWEAHGEFVEGEMWLRRVLRCSGDLCTAETLAQLHEGLALLLARHGILAEAAAEASRSLGLFGAANHEAGCIRVRNLMGMVALERRRHDDTRSTFACNQKAARRTDSRVQEVVPLNALGRLAECEGDLDAAGDYFGPSLRKARANGIANMVAALANLAEVSAERRGFADALDYARRGMREARAIENSAIYARLALQTAAFRVREHGVQAATNEIATAREALQMHRHRADLTADLDTLAEALIAAGWPESAAHLLAANAGLREDGAAESVAAAG